METLKDLFELRQVKFMGRRISDFMLSGKASLTNEELQLAAKAKKGQVRISRELEELYNKVTHPVVKVSMVGSIQTYTVLVTDLCTNEEGNTLQDFLKI